MEKYCGFRRPKIAVDLDDCMFANPIVPNIIKEYNLKVEKHSWDLHELGDKVLGDLYSRFLMPKFMCNLKPYPGNVEKLNKFHEMGFRIIAITSRDPRIKKETTEMVMRYCPYFEGVFFSKEYEGNVPLMKLGKNAALIKEGCSIFFDDSPKYIEAAMGLGFIKKFLISNDKTNYNWELRDKLLKNPVPDVTIVKSIAEIEL